MCTYDVDINKALVLGNIATGSEYFGSAFITVAWKTKEDVGKEKAYMAKHLGEVYKDGTPLIITVVADNGWSYNIHAALLYIFNILLSTSEPEASGRDAIG